MGAPNQASQTSVDNSLAGSGLNIAQESAEVEPLPPLNAFNAVPTGKQMDTEFLNQEWDDNWDDTKKELYYQVHVVGVRPTPESLAQDASKLLEEQRKRGAEMQAEQRKAEMQSKSPEARAGLAKTQAEAAAAQLALQDAYLQEMEYQSHLNTVNNPQASRAERQAAISAIDGLATAIGKRTMGSGAGSRDAMTAGKKAVGFIDWKQEYNPFADYTPQVDVMRRGSDNRLGTIRQQMEAAGVPVPEFKGAAAAPQANPSQMVLERFGVKASDGNPVMLNGSPVVSFKRGGKDVMMRQTPNGGFVELTTEEAAALRGQ